jgi:hypothetical protein
MSARLDVTVRSSGWGPRGPLYYVALGSLVPAFVPVLPEVVGELWPRDGVAIVIRRAS